MSPSDLARRLTHRPANMDDLQTSAPDWGGAVASILTLSGDLRPAVEQVFPDESAIHVILAKLPRRQVWWAVLSAIEIDRLTNAEALRENLLMCSEDALLHARFGDKAQTLGPLLRALSPRPLPRAQYDVLAALADEEADRLRSWIARDGHLDSYKLTAHLFPDVATMDAVLREEGTG